jgi:hypothetical protein
VSPDIPDQPAVQNPLVSQQSTISELKAQLAAVKARIPEVLAKLEAAQFGDFAGFSQDDKCQYLEDELEASIAFVSDEPQTNDEIFHSRDPIAGVIQSVLNDKLPPVVVADGQGNPIVWIPSGIDGLLERVRGKYPFKTATVRSQIAFPAQCKIALLGDWGAPNLHAKRIGDLAIAKGAEYVIHLGDIYYSGTQSECQTFVNNWPLKGAEGNPIAGKSFALNGNHEMYSNGTFYFTTVLDAFQQEASYFTLYNDWWQIQGIDTAYVPFSIDGGGQDDRLQQQWAWLSESVFGGPAKRNIFLSHQQPVSSHLQELEDAYTLKQQFLKFVSNRDYNRIHAWFFGHEHRCEIYDDADAGAYFKARLIGNGSIPHPPQNEDAAAIAANGAKATAVWRVNHGTVGDGATAISSFAMLTFDEDKCIAEYWNEDGTLFYKEDLAGGPNSEIE